MNLKPKFVTNWFFYRRQKLAKIKNEIGSREIKDKSPNENFSTELKNSLSSKDLLSQHNITNVENLKIKSEKPKIKSEKPNLIDINNNNQISTESLVQNPFLTQNILRNPFDSYNNNRNF